MSIMDKTEIKENETCPVKPAESESCRDKIIIAYGDIFKICQAFSSNGRANKSRNAANQ
jgi:regulator of replication initiation timing